ncbi:MAG: hypothetical protein ACREF3_04165, partial [Acetobacteraceae bacterium]
MDGSQFVGPIGPAAGISTTIRRRQLSLRQWLATLAAVGLLAVIGLYGRYYWTTGRFLVSTDDATVQA